MKISWTTILASFLFVACGSDDDYSATDPFLLELPKHAQSHAMPEGFIEKFTADYLAEVEPGIARIRSTTPPIEQDLEIWNLRVLIYTNLWGEHGVDTQYLPPLAQDDYESLKSEMEEMRNANERLEVETLELKARIQKFEATPHGTNESAAAPTDSPQESKEEPFKKKASLYFPSDDEARKWSFGTLSLGDWVTAMSKQEWKILHQSETNEFFVAIWRSADHLIFHQYPKPGAEYGYTIKVEGDPEVVIVERQDDVSIRYQISSPNEFLYHHDSFTALRIMEGYSGEITLSCTENGNAEVTAYKVRWDGNVE